MYPLGSTPSSVAVFAAPLVGLVVTIGVAFVVANGVFVAVAVANGVFVAVAAIAVVIGDAVVEVVNGLVVVAKEGVEVAAVVVEVAVVFGHALFSLTLLESTNPPPSLGKFFKTV